MTDTTRASAVLDGEHWQGTPEHIRYTLGCQIERLAEVSVGLDTEDVNWLIDVSAAMNNLARTINATPHGPVLMHDEDGGRR